MFNRVYRFDFLTEEVYTLSIPKWGFSLSVLLILLFIIPSIASANVFKDLYNLPGDVGELREQYDETKSQLEAVTRRSQETLKQYEESQLQIEQLNKQNEQLLSQNERLADAVISLQQAEEARANKVKLWWRYAYIGIGLLALYFISGRLVRVLLRSRQF